MSGFGQMLGLGKPKAAPQIIEKAPAPLPSERGPDVRDARRRAREKASQRRGRASTILSGYSNDLLGQT